MKSDDGFVNDLMEILVAIAKKHHDGHFTVMRFTGNWRVQIGAQDFEGREDITKMSVGATFEEAAVAAIKQALIK